MHTSSLSLLSQYETALEELKQVSGGLYPGPSQPVSALKDKFLSIDGIEPAQLVQQTRAGTGRTRTPRGRAGILWTAGSLIVEGIASALAGIAGGKIVDKFLGAQDDDEEDNERCDDLNNAASQCAEAIDDICSTTDQGISSLLLPTLRIVSIVTGILRLTPAGAAGGLILESVIGLVENTNSNVDESCRDRDNEIKRCYEEFENYCDRICDRELPEPAPIVVICNCPHPHPEPEPEPEPTPEPEPNPEPEPKPTPNPPIKTDPEEPYVPPKTKPVGVDPVNPSDPAQKDPVVKDPTTKEPAPKDPVTTNPVGKEPEPTKPAPPKECEAEPIQEPECETDEEPKPKPVDECDDVSVNCTGILGLVGAGIAIVGIGALMVFIGEQLEAFANTPEPEPAPAPEPAPKPTPEPAPKPEPEPAPKPQDPVDLSKVPEPEPPPKKIVAAAVDSPAQGSSVSSGVASSGVASSGAASSGVASNGGASSAQAGGASASMQANSSMAAGSSSPARKVGAW